MPAVQETVDRVRQIDVDQYKYGFVTDIESEKAPKGLSEDTVRYISAKKNEPEWMLNIRLKALRTFEKQILLRVLDDLWKDHLSTMDHLRHGIHLRGYAQKNPKQEYKREAFELFSQLLDVVKLEVHSIHEVYITYTNNALIKINIFG